MIYDSFNNIHFYLVDNNNIYFTTTPIASNSYFVAIHHIVVFRSYNYYR